MSHFATPTMKYGHEKCPDCGVVWRVTIDGDVHITTNTCQPTKVCISCLDKYSKLAKAAKKAHEVHEKRESEKKTKKDSK